MDLAVIDSGSGVSLQPRSVLGVLWLQTHFEASSWDLICSGQARLRVETREALCRDARAAGLQLCPQ